MTPAEEERRGVEAEHLLTSAIYREAYEAIEERLINLLASADTDDERADRVRHLLIAHRKVRKYMEQIVTTGTMAAMHIERERSVMERMRDRVRKVV